MPHAFVQLTPELDRACREALVLTTTERLRRNLMLAYDRARQAAGERAWETPRVRTLDSYLASLHTARASVDPALPELLPAEAEFQLFRSTAPRGNVSLVPLAREAWNLSHQWSIPIAAAGFGHTEGGRVFLDWTERLRRRLDAEQLLTRAELAGRHDLVASAPELVCLAFERIPNAFSAWLERQADTGCRIEFVAPASGAPAQTLRTAFDTPAQELAAAAQWSRRHLETDPSGRRIGIVVPDLARRQQEVVRQFTAVFDPSLETGTHGVLDVAGGTALGGQPVWQGARDWLRLCFDVLPAAAARRCLNDQFLALPGLDRLPPSLPQEVDLRTLDRAIEQPALRALLGRLPETGNRPLGDWLQTFADLLDSAGWSGHRAGSVQFQAWREIRRKMAALAAATDGRRLPVMEALATLEQLLDTTTFAPERPPALVQVMGYLETTGLHFSHLWVTGLDDQSWPQLPTQNPFLPVATRRRHGVARTTAEEEADFAAERLRQWRRSTDVLVVSHARLSLESELRPSPLIRVFPEATLLDLQPRRAHPHFTARGDHLERIEDFRGAPLAGGRHRGGTGRIRDQAICPIRGYAIHRLELAESRAPHGLPDALDRGTLVHEALHRLYEPCVEGGRVAEQMVEADFERAADRALVRHYARFPEPFRIRERRRLVALLKTWNALECQRTDSHIEALELDTTATFDGLGLRLRIDRMDRIDDALVVIDYKTGRVGYRLNDDRLVEPQLPLYALTNAGIRGVLYAEVDERQPRLKGIADVAAEGASVDLPVTGSWERQLERWQRQIDTLTREIRDGVATVTPHAPTACQTCHLQAFCRIDGDGDEP
ncbi:MAG: PD-(D/E)XK nuclease family protein [Pseudomonadales bacterium]